MSEDIDSGEYVEAAAPVADEAGDSYETQSQEEGKVPLSALQAERRERQKLQENFKLLQDHVSLMQSTQQQSQQSSYDDSDDDDVLTKGEAKKYISQLQNQYQSSLSEMKIQQQNPDYQEVITKYLPEVIQKYPELRDEIAASKNPYKLAYFIAKNSDAYRDKNKQVKRHSDAEKILSNAQKASSLSSTGSSAPASPVKNYKKMSDDEFRKLANRNRGYF